MVMNSPLEQKLEHIIRRMQADTSIDAPADALKYVSDLFRTRAAEPKPTLVQRLVAALKVDLVPDRAAFGERSASSGKARQMWFDAGEYAIDLRVTSGARGFDIRGQILGGLGPGEVVLTGVNSSTTAVVDDEGGFRIDSVNAGTYTIVITGRSSELVVENIEFV
jgi:hypothetical protein